MSAWTIVAIAGGVMALVIVVLLVVVSRAVMRTTQNATALLDALEDVRTNTLVLADLEATAARASRAMDDTQAAIQELRETDHGDNGRDPEA